VKHNVLSTQAWQVEATESIWSIVRRVLDLDRPTVEQSESILGFPQDYGEWDWMLYRKSIAINSYEILRRSLGLSVKQVYAATLPILPNTHGGPPTIRFCSACMKKGFHSSVFQIPWIKFCPIHQLQLRDKCEKCHHPLKISWDSLLISIPYLCHECLSPLGSSLGTAKCPMSTNEKVAFHRIRRDYDKAYRSIRGYSFPRQEYPVSHWDLMQLSSKRDLSATDCSDLKRIYCAEGKVITTSQTGSELLEDRENLHKNFFEVRTHLMPILKAFRRHLEKFVPKSYMKELGYEKRGVPCDNNTKNCANEGFHEFLTWKLFWRNLLATDSSRHQYLIKESEDYVTGYDGRFFLEQSPNSKWRSPCLKDYEIRMQEVVYLAELCQSYIHLKTGLKEDDRWSWDTLFWVRQHAFCVYLLSLRDEARAMANAMSDYSFTWPYSISPLEGRLMPLITLAKCARSNKLEFFAWQSSKTMQEIDIECYKFIWKKKQDRIKFRSAIEALRRQSISTPSPNAHINSRELTRPEGRIR